MGSSILLLDFNFFTQRHLKIASENYPRLRDFYSSPPLTAPLIHHALFIAAAINATLVSTTNFKESTASIPTLYYIKYGTELLDIYDKVKYENGKAVNLFFVSRFSLPWNYVFCDFKHLESPSPLKVFESTADSFVWLCLGSSLITLTFVIRTSPKKLNFSVFMPALSSLLTPGVEITSTSLRHSYLFNLWMFTSFVFLTYFSGRLTSVVISPSREYRMTKIAHLRENNYSTVFRVTAELNFVTTHLTKLNGSEEECIILKYLIASTMVTSTNEQDFPETLALTSHRAYLAVWPVTIYAATRANEVLWRAGNSNKRCYIGEELFFDQNTFISMSAFTNTRLPKIMKVLMESGIFLLWYKEYVGIATSHRVQERSKVISRTKLLEEKEQPKALQLADGKFKNVFLLWISCCLLSLAAFIGEKFLTKTCIHHNTIYIIQNVKFKNKQGIRMRYFDWLNTNREICSAG